ncbi:hypothetical protein GCM10008905_23940 [Clostridium malenominatum]|uniref:Diguanylate cyclase (GGDEF) domain-containing protein n=2 Tax=Clostridium malenominatum TaxID=1539 RepID=A0ABP3U8J4_9CLOT
MHEMKKLKFFGCIFFLIALLILKSSLVSSAEIKNILVLHSYNEGFAWTGSISKGINSVFDNGNINVNIKYDYMDLKENSSEEYIHTFFELQKSKYSHIKFDIIIASDNGVMEYLSKYGEELFNKVPVVFCGINEINPSILSKHSEYKIVVENIEVEEMVKNILSIFPNTRTFKVFGSDSTSGKNDFANIKRLPNKLSDNYEFNFYENTPIDKVKLEIESSNKNTAFIFLTDPFIDENNHYRYINNLKDDFFKNSAVPLFSFWDFDLGYGTFGGKVTSAFYQGEEVGKIALSILKGSSLESIPNISQSPNKYMFDYNQLKRFRINVNALPEGSIIVNEPYSFFEKYKSLVIGAIVTFLFLITVISFLTIIINEKRKNEMKLSNSYDELSAVYEELAATEEELRAQYEELQENENRIEEMAYYDKVTGLPNRNYIMERFEIKNSALIFLDIDEFKKVNDTLGHNKGDELLKKIAFRLKKYSPSNSMVGRFGGDEFLILIPEFYDIKELEEICNNLINMFKVPFILDGVRNYVTASLGISVAPMDGEEIDVLLKNADTAMYRAKEQGKNQYCFFNHTMSKELLRKISIENNLRHALKKNEFKLYYQPQINLYSGKIEGMEALLRWNNKELGFVSPNEFIPIAEKNGLIVPIGNWVMKKACQQNKIWLSKGFKYDYIGINVSSIQFVRDDFVNTVSNVLEREKLPSSYLDIEITESLLIDSTENNINKLKDLKSMGVKISLDDFGTGYSSLNYLMQFPINKLKIDKSFVQNICNNKEQELIIDVIINLSKRLGQKVVAEGVETKEQLELLKSMGCDIAQGYYFSKPLSVEDMEELLKKNL